MSVAEPARENPRSRRHGTSKAWVTWMMVNRTARGPSTEPRSPVLAWAETVRKNQTKAITTARASTSLRNRTGRARRR